MHKQEDFDRQADLLLPRVYNKKDGYLYYPVFSDLGITWEAEEYDITDHEHMLSLRDVFMWKFDTSTDETSMYFNYDLDRYTGAIDCNGVKVYENDIIEDGIGRQFVIKYSEYHLKYRLDPYNDKAKKSFTSDVEAMDWFLSKDDKGNSSGIKVISNTHKRDKE